MMIIKNYEYNGYKIEIHEHPIYHDFEFVIKSLDEKEVIGTSTHTYDYAEDAIKSAQLIICNL